MGAYHRTSCGVFFAEPTARVGQLLLRVYGHHMVRALFGALARAGYLVGQLVGTVHTVGDFIYVSVVGFCCADAAGLKKFCTCL